MNSLLKKGICILVGAAVACGGCGCGTGGNAPSAGNGGADGSPETRTGTAHVFAMPEDYELSEDQLKEKRELRAELGLTLNADGSIAEKPEDYECPEDLIPDSVVLFTDDRGEAELVAAAFGGRVGFCAGGLASIELGEDSTGKKISSVEAVFASAAGNTNLPPLHFDHAAAAMG